MDDGTAAGIALIAAFTVAFLVGTAGVRTGRAASRWTVVLAVSGAGIAAGALLIQDQPDTASWVIAPLVGAVLPIVHARTLFAPGGPFRT